MAFEVYLPRGTKKNAGKSPMVSFSKNSIVLNSIARAKLNSTFVELAYDRNTNTVRIRALPEGNSGGMLVKKTKIFGKGFYNYFKIYPRGKYEAAFVQDERALYIDLTQK